MTNYDIVFSEPAEADMENAYHYLLLRSPQAAVKLRNGLEAATQSLEQMPSRCPLAPENGRLDRPIHQLLYRHGSTTYRILFIIFDADGEDAGVVRIIRVLHGAQQPLNLVAEPSDEDIPNEG